MNNRAANKRLRRERERTLIPRTQKSGARNPWAVLSTIEVAAILGITNQSVCEIERRALAKLRQRLATIMI